MAASFWEQHPALLTGISILLGTASSIHFNFVYFIILITLIIHLILSRQWIKCILTLVPFITAWMITSYRNPHLQLASPTEGIAQFTIHSIKQSKSPFYQSLVYQGDILLFTSSDGTCLKHLPCHIYVPPSKRPPANAVYLINGKLIQKGDRHFILKPQKNLPWQPLDTTWGIAEMRYRAQQHIHHYLKHQIKNSKVTTFLNALITGHLDDPSLASELGHLGLQHILAISGFHFALIALFLNRLLQLMLPSQLSSFLLLLSLSTYYCFLGYSPSIERAWIAISLFLTGQIFSLRITPLNALGVGLCYELITNPWIITHIGFQLSFLCTLAILLLYPLCHRLCQYLLPTRNQSEAQKMSLLDQHGFIISTFIRKSLAITLSVHLFLIPTLLFLFHRFPLLSLIYNFFFPLWASLSLLLLCIALITIPIPYLSDFIHTLNTYLTNCALTVTSNPPALLDLVVRSNTIPFEGLLLFLTALFFLALYYNEKKEHQNIL